MKLLLTILIVCLMQVYVIRFRNVLINVVEHQITPNMHLTLSSEFIVDEIKAALFQMGTIKALGPDGMNALFYQKFWHVVGDSVVSAVLDYLNSGVMFPDINH